MPKKTNIEDILTNIIVFSIWLGYVLLGILLIVAPIIRAIRGDYWGLLQIFVFWPSAFLIFILTFGIPYAIAHCDPRVFRQDNYADSMPDE